LTGRPIIAIPTTSGTGSEVTRVCVLSDPEHRRKASIRTDAMLPRVAIVDPELTVSCPGARARFPREQVTAHSGADALVQAVEAYVSRGANPMTDALAREAAQLAAGALPRAVADGADRAAREAMALASTMAGLALNTARLGLVHGIAHAAGAVTGAAHGLLCGLLLPYVIEFNLPAAAAKYAELARAVGAAGPDDSETDAAHAFLAFARDLLRQAGIPERLSDVGFPEDALPHWGPRTVPAGTAETMPSGSTQANPRPVSPDDALAVCWRAF
jgi:alcohol dehydrogenase